MRKIINVYFHKLFIFRFKKNFSTFFVVGVTVMNRVMLKSAVILKIFKTKLFKIDNIKFKLSKKLNGNVEDF